MGAVGEEQGRAKETAHTGNAELKMQVYSRDKKAV